MPRRRHIDRPVKVTLNITESLQHRVNLALYDPTLGRPGYGAWKNLIVELLEGWLSNADPEQGMLWTLPQTTMTKVFHCHKLQESTLGYGFMREPGVLCTKDTPCSPQCGIKEELRTAHTETQETADACEEERTI